MNERLSWRLTGIDTKFSFGQSQPCEMSSRSIKKAIEAVDASFRGHGGHEHTVTMFLFRQAHKDFLREPPGAVCASLTLKLA